MNITVGVRPGQRSRAKSFVRTSRPEGQQKISLGQNSEQQKGQKLKLILESFIITQKYTQHMGKCVKRVIAQMSLPIIVEKLQ